ncbi:NADH-quinone oxidoreductase subunit E [Frigidibacter sp. MR17.24]|uniref:NADH-quinone oxidoreductase subunit E n=1 Tax=Frigidibacter sp. MR17.24 TaxID=3127345 RepID=UPI003012C7DF
MLRRLHPVQPESFEFTPANLAWAKGQIAKYPEGRQASAIIPLLFRAQEQEGWLSRPAIEYVAGLLDLAYIRALEVATFYFMFQLQPTGSIAHFQICGTTSCMIVGAEDLMEVCKRKIAAHAHEVSADGKFSWEEVECLGACANAPMAQIGKDYYEDLTPAGLEKLIDELAAGNVPRPGSEIGRYSSEPAGGLTSLTEFTGGAPYNGSVQRAVDIGETVKRIDGTEVPISTPWIAGSQPQVWEANPAYVAPGPRNAPAPGPEATPGAGLPADETGVTVQEAPAESAAAVEPDAAPEGPSEVPVEAGGEGVQPQGLSAPRDGGGDDLKVIEGVGPKLEETLNGLGIYHYEQIANWTPAEVAWVDGNLKGFRGRVTRDKWVAQAKLILEVGREEFLRRAKTNDY